MHNYKTNYSIVEHAIGGMYFCKYTLLFRVARGVGVKTMQFCSIMCSSLRTTSYDIKVVLLTTETYKALCVTCR